MGYLYPSDVHRLRVKPEPVKLHSLVLMGAALPPGRWERRLDRGGKALAKKGCSRVLLHRELRHPGASDLLAGRGICLVDPLPLCRAKAPELVMAFVEELPLRRRCVALRGEDARAAWPAAAALCPQVGALLLDFRRGQRELAERLRWSYGAAALSIEQGGASQVCVDFSPCGEREGKRLKLWGEPDLAGLYMAAGEETDLSVLELLWEEGRLRPENITVQNLDRQKKKPYNVGTM